MADEIYTTEDFIRTTLAADTALRTAFLPFIPAASQAAFVLTSRIHIGSAPQGAVFPLIVIEYAFSERDVMEVGQRRINARPVFRVKVVNNTRNFGSISPIWSRVDVLLHTASGLASGGNVMSLTRLESEHRQEDHSGVVHSISGGFFRAQTQAA